jgi:antitoxin component YwqK of YwqJK toxin-antitoxin module
LHSRFVTLKLCIAMKNSIYLTVIIILSFFSSFAQQDQEANDFRDSPREPVKENINASLSHPEYRSPVNSQATNNIFHRVKKPITINKSGVSYGVAISPGTLVGLSATGDTQFIAHFKRNKLKGNWISKFDQDQLCDSGNIENNIPDGLWKSWYPNGNLRFIRTYDAFKLQKAKQDIPRRNSKSVSSSIAEIAKTNIVIAYSFLNPDYSFHTLAAHPVNFSSFKGWLTLNERVANNINQESFYFPPFVECLHHGLYMNFYENGAVKDSGYYRNGLREGIWEEWLDDGATRSNGFYSRGHKVDTWKFYNQQGQLLYVKSFDRNGRETNRKTFRLGLRAS